MKRSRLDAVLSRNKWSQVKDVLLTGALVVGFAWVALFTQSQLSQAINGFEKKADPIAETSENAAPTATVNHAI